MTKLESLDQLRDLAADINANEIIDHMELYPSCVFDGHWLDAWHRQFDKLLEAIQTEIDSRYMLLPMDADGVPIHVGDYLRFCDFDIQCAAVSPERVYYWDEYSDAHWVKGCECHHVKPRTVEDVLREFAKSGTPTGDGGVLFETALIEKYADELQMRGDAE